MAIYVCKQCGAKFSYCPRCELRPAKYKDYGFCSKECYEQSKKEVIQTEDVEVVITDRDTSTSE